MELRGKKLGLLVCSAPEEAAFMHAIGLARAAIAAGAKVYLYCIDEAVRGIDHPKLQSLKDEGLNLFGCAYAANRREITLTDAAVFSGLGTVSDLMAGTDRFLVFP
jgi:DsrE/DsrF-like family